jgi:hypothetical protein
VLYKPAKNCYTEQNRRSHRKTRCFSHRKTVRQTAGFWCYRKGADRKTKRLTAVLGGIARAVFAALVVGPGGVLVGVLVFIRGLGAVRGTIAGTVLVRILIRMLVFGILGAVLAVVRAIFHDQWLLSSMANVAEWVGDGGLRILLRPKPGPHSG